MLFRSIVEGIGPTFENHRTVPADDGGLALRGAAYEEFIWIGLAASSLGHPGDTGLGLRALDETVC